MRAQQLRTIILAHPDPVDIQTALDKLRAGDALTPTESGVAAVESVRDVQLAAPPVPMFFDGSRYVQVLYVTTG